MTAIVLTGIGGLGKSTLAALVYRSAEAQRLAGTGPFTAETLWLRIDPAITMVDLAGSLFEVLQKPLPQFANLPPQNQALTLHNVLNTVDRPRLIILDQFEDLLDWQTGHALSDHPGVGEWLAVDNSEPNTCRVLITSRLWPRGTREYPPTYMQEYNVKGLGAVEGTSLLRNQGVEVAQGTDAQLRQAVVRCEGHALALTLLASILRRNRSLNLTLLFNDPLYAPLWVGEIARSFLDYIFTHQLNEVERKLLQAFSVYREPVPLDAAQALIAEVPKVQILPALNILLAQHLLNAVGDGRYQLHAIVADYAQAHFVEGDEQTNLQALRVGHERAARYYLQQAAKMCPPLEKRRRLSDVYPFIEAAWQYCQAQQWQKAYKLMEQENLFSNLNLWGGNAILLELCRLLLPRDKWHPKQLHTAQIYNYLGRVYKVLGVTDHALKYLNLALSMYKKVGDRKGEAAILINVLGMIYNKMGMEERALEYHEQASKIQKELSDLEV